MALKLLNPSLRPLGQFDLADSQTLVGGECVKLQSNSPAAGDAASDSKKVGPFEQTSNQVEFALGTFEIGKLCGLADEGSAGYGTQFGTQIGQGAGLGVQVPLNTGAYTAGGVTVIGPSTDKASGKVTVWHAPGLYAIDAAACASTPENIDVFGFGTADPAVGTDVAIAVTEMTGAAIAAATATNLPLFAANAAADKGKLFVGEDLHTNNGYSLNGGQINGTATRSSSLGTYVGYLKDSSLVSTPTNLAAPGGGLGADRNAGSAYSSEAEEYVIYFLGNQGLV